MNENIDIYQFQDYRSFIKTWVKVQKNSWGLWARLSKAANCQPAYFTQAMKGSVQLTQEHILNLSEYLKLNQQETEYFLLLLEYQRAGTKNLSSFYLKKISYLQKEKQDLSNRLNRKNVEIQLDANLYYSAWYWSAIHIMTTIPEFQTTNAIAERLCIPVETTMRCLQSLKEQGLIVQESNRWKWVSGDIHIPKKSPLIGMHHKNWRDKAVQDSLEPNTDGIHFTTVSSISKKDFELIKKRIFDLIDEAAKITGPSQEEELICFTCDIFKV